MIAKLTPEEINGLAKAVPLWTLEDADKAITRALTFVDFKQAFAFMTYVAAEADRADHHPEWSNVYNRVSIRLTTHDSGGLTQKDIGLAQFIDGFASKYGA